MVLLLALLVVGCEEERLPVRTSSDTGQLHGRKELLAAVERFARSDRSPVEFRSLALAIEALRSRFDEDVAAEAERNLVLLALDPLEALHDRPPDAQLSALATTVWPTALEVQPRDGEDPLAYTERICAGALARQCKHVVPEYRALVLSALVWTRLEDRAREAHRECKNCTGVSGMDDAVDRYDRHARELETRVASAEERAEPDAWPHAGEHAAPWSGPPVVVVDEQGRALLDGAWIAPGTWTERLAAVRKRAEVLGAYLQPTARVEDLRALAREARAAGFGHLALQVRSPEYPYGLAEYRIATRQAGGERVRVRDVDTIQVLVQALDVMADRSAGADRTGADKTGADRTRPPRL